MFGVLHGLFLVRVSKQRALYSHVCEAQLAVYKRSEYVLQVSPDPAKPEKELERRRIYCMKGECMTAEHKQHYYEKEASGQRFDQGLVWLGV